MAVESVNTILLISPKLLGVAKEGNELLRRDPFPRGQCNSSVTQVRVVPGVGQRLVLFYCEGWLLILRRIMRRMVAEI